MFVLGLTLGHQIWVYLYIIFAIFFRLYLTLQQMYGVDVKEGGREGVGTSKNFF